MGGIFKAPKIPAPPPIQAPPEPDFSYEDEQREKKLLTQKEEEI